MKYIFDGNAEELDIENYFGDNPVLLSKFFSIRNRKDSDLVEIREGKIPDISNKKKSIKTKLVSYINYEPEKIRELVFILSSERADNYSQWIEVGWVLHNIDPNSQELLDIWIDFSKQSTKFKDGECEKVWDSSKNEGLTIATLHYWAKIDNYQKYLEFKNE